MNKTDIINLLHKLNKRALGMVRELREHGPSIVKKVNTRAMVIIAALALPIVLLAIVIHTGTPQNPARRPAHAARQPVIPPHLSLEQRLTQIRERLAYLKRMTPDQWERERRVHPWAANSLQDAIDWNTKRLAELEAITPEQWEAKFRPSPPPPQPQRQQESSALDIIPKPPNTPKFILPSTSR